MKRDVSMWVPDEFHEHDFYDIARDISDGLIENIELFDHFKNLKREKKTQSFAFHIIYRANDRTLTEKEVNDTHKNIVAVAISRLKVEIR